MKERRVIALYLYFYSHDRYGMTTHDLSVSLCLSADTSLAEILEFSKGCKKIFSEAVKIAERGDCWRNLSLCSTHYNAFGECRTNGWTADVQGVGEDDNGKKYIHFTPDTEDTDAPSWCDMCVYSDVLKSIAECGLV